MEGKNKIVIIAHRGASSIAPENTLKAFQKAIELGANGIEFDVQESKDGKLVITHDDDIKRITGKQGLVKEMTYDALKSLDFGQGEQIPTLQEVIELTKGKIFLNCEIKAEGITKKIVDVIREYNITESILISSFKHEELLKIQKIEPMLKLASLEPITYYRKYEWNNKQKMIQYCIDNKFFAINPIYPIVDQEFVDFAHNNSIRVYPWTVDSKPTMRKLLKLGVDGIITNDTTKLKQILNS